MWSNPQLLKKALMETSLFVQCMSARKVFKICHSHEYVKDCNTSLVSSVTEYESKFLLFLLLIFSLMMTVLILSWLYPLVMWLKSNVFIISLYMLFISPRFRYHTKYTLVEYLDLRGCYKSSSHTNGYVCNIIINCISNKISFLTCHFPDA